MSGREAGFSFVFSFMIIYAAPQENSYLGVCGLYKVGKLPL